MPNTNWIITFYRASVDSATSTYTEVLKTTVAGYANYATTTAYITQPRKTKDVQGELITDVNGWTDGILSVRDIFSVKLWSYKFTASATDPDLDDWETLCDWLNLYDHLWISVSAGGRLYPSDTTKAHPVVIESVDEAVNDSEGTHEVALNMRVKGLR